MVLARVRKMMPASILTHWPVMMVFWVLILTSWFLETASLSSAVIA